MRFFAPSYDISFLFDHFDREIILFLSDNKRFHEIRIIVILIDNSYIVVCKLVLIPFCLFVNIWK